MMKKIICVLLVIGMILTSGVSVAVSRDSSRAYTLFESANSYKNMCKDYCTKAKNGTELTDDQFKLLFNYFLAYAGTGTNAMIYMGYDNDSMMTVLTYLVDFYNDYFENGTQFSKESVIHIITTTVDFK